MAQSATDVSSLAPPAPTALSVSHVHKPSLCIQDFVSPVGTITVLIALRHRLGRIARPVQADIMLIAMLFANNVHILHAKPAIRLNASHASLNTTSSAAPASLAQPAALIAVLTIPVLPASKNIILIALNAMFVANQINARPVQPPKCALNVSMDTSFRGLSV